jgi:Protein of unknown function (DUF2934)
MLETASTKPQRRRQDRSAPPRAIDRTPQDEGDLSPSIASSAHRPPESRMNRIARRAHEIYEARGGEHGKALEDWLQAERDIDSELEAEPGIDR